MQNYVWEIEIYLICSNMYENLIFIWFAVVCMKNWYLSNLQNYVWKIDIYLICSIMYEKLTFIWCAALCMRNWDLSDLQYYVWEIEIYLFYSMHVYSFASDFRSYWMAYYKSTWDQVFHISIFIFLYLIRENCNVDNCYQ